MFDSIVLGVDPGVARLGLAALARRGRTTTLLWADTVRTGPGTEEPDRLLALVRSVRAAIATHDPGVVALERVAFNRNAVSALGVARATGAILVVAAESGLGVAEYSPTEVKSAVTGMGHADKAQILWALERVHGLRGLPAQPDAADAAAVALTHLAAAGLRGAMRAAR